ncbi:hypothetical protein G9A89_007435 [Geosiphon pyriformis]|nr:hypothetical protein G9A89_007435 [Geosiphon pyriformis]
MGDYLYLSQQSEKHFVAHNKNDLDFIELNPFRQFQDFWNWFLNKHSAETYTAYTIYYFNQAYFEDDFEKRNNFENPFETEEKSYQTAPIFDIFSSESEHSTQTVTPEPMAQDSIQANILAALQGIQTALGGDVQDLIKWLDDFKRAVTANQYDDKKLMLMPIKELLDECQQMSEKTTLLSQPGLKTSPGEIVTEYAKAIRKLIKHVDSGKNWTEEQKIHSFTKGLRTDLSYALWSLLVLKNNPTIDMAIKLAQ